jgi:hypothetical protein
MKLNRSILLIVSLMPTACTVNAKEKPIPLEDGQYFFEHKYAEAEHYQIKSIQLIVEIDGRTVVVINNDRFDVFAQGVLEEGTLMWHSKSRQWIIGDSPTDRNRDDIGGCSGGPNVIDLVNRIYWTC